MNFKYNPGFSSDEDLISAFVVREKELQQILQTIQENTGRTYQHLLLVGARGTGKTMLVRRVAAEVRRSELFNQHWYPLVFGEESYRILSAGEFWLEALSHLAAQNPGSQWQGVYEELRGEQDEKRLQQRAIAKLMDFADEQGKQIVLIVENLNMLFSGQMREGADWDLRYTLQNEPRLMLLGTATQRFDAINNIEKALFEFLSLHELKRLNTTECVQLWNSVIDEALSENQIKPLEIFTGGNPRLLKIIADFAKGMSIEQLMSSLTQLIDEHTDLFKGFLDNLAPTERKVLIALLEKWNPLSTKEIADTSRLQVSKVSSLLKRLVDRGVVEVVEDSPKTKKEYQVSERLFNIYYLMRQNSDTTSQLRNLLNFISYLYEDKPQIVHPDSYPESSTLESVLQRIQQVFQISPIEEEKLKMILSSAEKLGRLHGEEKERVISSIDDCLSGIKNSNLKSEILFALPDIFFAQASLPKSVGTLDYMSFRNLVRYNQRTSKFNTIESSLRKYLDEFPEDACVQELLGFLLHQDPNRYKEAIDAYETAIEKDPSFVLPLVQLGIIKHERLQEIAEAEDYFLQAIKIKSKYEWAWVNFSRMIASGNYSDRIRNLIEELILSGDNNIWSKTLRGMLSLEIDQNFDEAQQIFQDVSKANPTFPFVWQQLIRLHHKRGKFLQQWPEELMKSKEVINETCKYMWLSPNIIEFIIDAAAAGHADTAIKMLNESEAADELKPLIVGLSIFRGGKRPLVAQEVFEIGKDVADQIRTKQAELNELPPIVLKAEI